MDGNGTVEGAATSPAPALAKGAHMAVAYQGVAYQAEDEAADVRAGAIAAIAAVAASLAGAPWLAGGDRRTETAGVGMGPRAGAREGVG